MKTDIVCFKKVRIIKALTLKTTNCYFCKKQIVIKKMVESILKINKDGVVT